MIYVSGYESKDTEYQTEILVGDNINQKIILNKDFNTIRFLYPHTDSEQDLAIYINIIDQALYNIKIYLNTEKNLIRNYIISKDKIVYLSKSEISDYCELYNLCNIIVEISLSIKNINIIDEPMFEITFRQIKSIPSYVKKNIAKNHFINRNNYYYLYTDIGKNEIGEIYVNF